MGRKRNPGLYKREDTWHIDKWVLGERLCESCGTGDLAEAERHLSRRIEQIRQVKVYGSRKKYSFHEAAVRYLKEKAHKKSLREDAKQLKIIEPFIKHLTIDQINIVSLQAFIEARKKDGVKNRTINYALGVVRHLLNLAATLWLDANGVTWLAHAPKIAPLSTHDARKPYPLSWKEQEQLFSELPAHLRQMALFKVNTGCREKEVCHLEWDWEFLVPELNTSVFVLPANRTKNGQERIIVLNHIAKQVIEEERHKSPQYVFTYKGNPMASMNNSAWQKARVRLKLPVRIHDLKHTFGMRLRAAGVTEEDRKDLLGHKSHSITTHYSAVEIRNLIEAANKACDAAHKNIAITLVKARSLNYVSTNTVAG